MSTSSDERSMSSIESPLKEEIFNMMDEIEGDLENSNHRAREAEDSEDYDFDRSQVEDKYWRFRSVYLIFLW